MVNKSWIGSWSWRIPPRGRALDDLNILHPTLNSALPHSNGYDKWVWTYEASGDFKVSTLSKIIDHQLLGVHSLGVHHKWNSWIPKKVNVMMWKTSLDRLATRPNLMARGMILPSPNCPFCDFTQRGNFTKLS